MKSKKTLKFQGKTYSIVEPVEYGHCRGCTFVGEYCPATAGEYDCTQPKEVIFVIKQPKSK